MPKDGCDELAALEQEVMREPRNVGARVRLGMAQVDGSCPQAGASNLRLAAQLDPSNPHIALLAVTALSRCGREREAVLLLSTQVRPTRTETVVAEPELAVLERLLAHRDVFVRFHLAKALGRLRIFHARGALERALSDHDGAVRMAARAALRLLLAH